MILVQLKNHLRKGMFLFLSFIILMLQASGQEEVPSTGIFGNDLLLTEVIPMHPFGIFTLNTPFYIGSFKSKGHKFSVGYSYANIWHPKSSIVYPQNMTSVQQKEANSLYITARPDYFKKNEIATQQKTFSTDGMLQNLSFMYLMQMGKKGSFIFKLNTHLLSGGGSPFHYLASDTMIEKAHKFVGLDNFGRRHFEYNQAHILYRDEDGTQIRIEKGQAFLGTLDVNYYLPLWLKENRASFFSGQLGAHLALPLNNYYPEVSGGFSGGMLLKQKVFPRFYIDLAGDFLLSHYSLVSFGNSVNMVDRNIRVSGKANLTFNNVSKKNRIFSYGLLLNYQDAYLEGYIFNRKQDKFRDLGVSYMKYGDIWEGKVVKVVPLSKLTAASMYFFSVKSYLYLGYKWNKSNLMLTAGEDYPVINNAPDIQLGVQYTRRFSD